MKYSLNNKTVITNATVKNVNFNDDNTRADLTLSYKAYDKDAKAETEQEVTVPFFNNQYHNFADRIMMAGIDEGTNPFNVMFAEKDGKCFGNGFCFSKGWFKLTGEKEDGTPIESNIICGYIATVREAQTSDGSLIYRVSIAIEVGAEKETKWFSISFFNNDTSKMADRAKKCLRKGDLVAIRTGPCKTTESNGKTYENYSGYNFDVIRKKSTKDDAGDTGVAGE